MTTSGPVAERAEHARSLLAAFRAANRADASRPPPTASWAEIAALEPEGDDPADLADYYELLAYEAQSRAHPGWAFVCFEAAATHAAQAGEQARTVSIRQRASELLEAEFPPFADDAEFLEDVRRWARERAAELGANATPADDGSALVAKTLALKHRWMFRLVQSQRTGRHYRLDALFDRFRLRAPERVLLRTLVAVHWDHRFDAARGTEAALTVGTLVDLVADDLDERPKWLACFDARAPLAALRLVHLGPGGALRYRTITVDESVLAWVDHRDAWPSELADRVRLLSPDDRPVYPYQDRPLHRLTRALDTRRRLAPRVMVRSGSEAASLNLLRTWAAVHQRPVLAVDDALDADAVLHALAREARLRSGVVFVPRAQADAASKLALRLPVPLVFDAPPAGLPAVRRTVQALVELELPPPAVGERPELWNSALVARGLPELNPRELEVRLSEFALDQAEIARIVEQAQERAWVDAQDHPTAVDLRAHVAAWLADQV